MKKVLIAVCAVLLMTSFALAAQPKSYQVTGPVLEVTDDVVTVQKGNDKWEIARDKDAKVTGGDLKVGSKVTIMYKMKADSIEVKSDGKPAAASKPAATKEQKKK
jgi:hypothetical protein